MKTIFIIVVKLVRTYELAKLLSLKKLLVVIFVNEMYKMKGFVPQNQEFEIKLFEILFIRKFEIYFYKMS
jgi:hypothetical protein